MRHRIQPSITRPAALGAVAAGPLLLLLSAAWPMDGESPAEAPAYGRDIRPILADRCFTCHGFDPGERRADLRLDLRESTTAPRAGGAAIVPGDAERSQLWTRIHTADPDDAMPPPEANRRRLSAEESELLRAWIDAGAEYEGHWAFQPPVRPAPPEVARSGWARNSIDRFVLAELEEHGLQPAEPAAPAQRLRRAFLDLTGLPPMPEELDAFLEDPGDAQFDAWVARLMRDEPYVSRFAERMATPWLDAARYGDTIGIHTDAGRQSWAWRDWVLEAYREHLPYDAFVTAQLSGDLFPGAEVADRVATGFNRNHVITDEGGAIDEEYLVEYAVDRVSTFGSVFLGLTLGCARCHDHKFDPVGQDDFYSLFAFFNSNDEPGLYSQEPDPNRAHEPAIEVPTPMQTAERAALAAEVAVARAALAARPPGEASEIAAFVEGVRVEAGVDWALLSPVAARSTDGAELTLLDDGSVLAGGASPANDSHVIEFELDRPDQRLLLIEALEHESLGAGGIGRAANGNAVLTEVGLEAESQMGSSGWLRRSPRWIQASSEQMDGDWAAVNAIDGDRSSGWAPDYHRRAGVRQLLVLLDEPLPTGRIRLTLDYRSAYGQHVLGRVRLSTSALGEAAAARLPLSDGHLHSLGAFAATGGESAHDTQFGPESASELSEGFEDRAWEPQLAFAAAGQLALSEVLGVHFLALELVSPTARTAELTFSSDDGIQLFLNGAAVYENRIDRGVTPDSDRAELSLRPGRNLLVAKVVNTGGPGGYQHRLLPGDDALVGPLTASLMPSASLDAAALTARDEAWRERFSPGHALKRAALAELEAERAELEARIPRTMVMRELPEPRPTFVLRRGAYDAPDLERPVGRAVPAVLGALPAEAPANRLGLAEWLFDPSNPLTARVAVNRLWAQVFGRGLVETLDDFGFQGAFPSHPELLDWLAVEFRESGWSTEHILGLMLESRTYAQSSRLDPASVAGDPDARFLSRFPRQRLSAEQVRDGALFVAGLLEEHFGGPSVKPYQPEGLWREVAMLSSNTRLFERGAGADLWRRSLYTYWKRASPPPAMLTFDAPTRESCTVERSSTNTPLQALVLFNDVQFVEAARQLAARTLAEPGDDAQRLRSLFRRCTSRTPDDAELESLERALGDLRARYAGDAAAAAALVGLGESNAPDDLSRSELAAWTLVANGVLSLTETLTRG